MFKFFKEYLEWKKLHRKEIQESQLRKDILKLPLNYNVLDAMFLAFTENKVPDAVMEIQGQGFTIKCYYDSNNGYKRLTTTEQILNSYKGV